MSIGALRIPRRLCRITVGPSLPESLSETCTAACLFTPLVLMCFCLLALSPSSVDLLGRTVLCTVYLAALALARASAASLYFNLLCPYTWVTDTDTDVALPCNNWYMSSHISWCLSGCLPFAIELRRSESCKLLKILRHHLESLFKHNSWVLRTARIPALTADTSALLFVCGPTTGSLMLSYST